MPSILIRLERRDSEYRAAVIRRDVGPWCPSARLALSSVLAVAEDAIEADEQWMVEREIDGESEET